MEGLDDPIVKNLINKLKEINWDGFKLYLVGGILEGWRTKDIDICILGNPNATNLFEAMEEARKLGPFDLFYVEVLKSLKDGPFSIAFAKSYDKVHSKAKQRPGEWKDGLFWQQLDFPIKKVINSERVYTKPPLLIHDGTLEF
jgi:hypothetical protein